MKISYLVVLLFVVFIEKGCFAQILEDFSEDDNFPGEIWCGDTEHFSVSGGMLRLSASVAGSSATACLCNSVVDECEWRCVVNLSFSPSANNCVRYYLMADDCDLLSPTLRGCYLQMGENGAADAIELFFQNGNSSVSFCRGTHGLLATAFQWHVRVLVVDSHWRIFIENPTTGEWLLEAEADMELPLQGDFYSGVMCRYTGSNVSKFSFDNFYVGPVVQDTIPPEVLAVEIDTLRNRLKVIYSENVDSSALSLSHYSCDGQYPLAAEYASQRSQIMLSFPRYFKPRINYVLYVSHIRDLSGNELEFVEQPFMHYVPYRNDIVISEIMSDPSPSVGLPEVEYVELRSRLPFPVNMQGWGLLLGKDVKFFPEYILEPEECAVVLAQSDLEQYAGLENKIPISSLSITNSAQQLALVDKEGFVVHYVSYNKNWHRLSLKQDGGWSAEMIDVDNPCGEADNWDSSVDVCGGTPGESNSLARSNPDLKNPELLHVTVADSMTLKLFFSETLLSKNLSPASFLIDHGVKVLFATALMPAQNTLMLRLSSPLRANTIYTLQIVDTLYDCAGNEVAKWSTASFGLPQQPIQGDVVINEVLANSQGTTVADFVELYNRSDKIIDVADLFVGTEEVSGGISVSAAFPAGYLLLPDQYVVLCRNSALTEDTYYCPYPRRLLQCDALPDYAQTADCVLLTDYQYQLIDRLYYTEDMHYSLLKSNDGVSLERLHPEVETQNTNNWKSASAGVGFATPGYRNSQFSDAQSGDALFDVSLSVFSPDGDGFEDYTECCCRFDEPNIRVTLRVFNPQGLLVRNLANNVPVGTHDCFVWDGVTEDGLLASPGFYVVHLQYWSSSGKRKSQAKVVGITFKNRVGQ